MKIFVKVFYAHLNPLVLYNKGDKMMRFFYKYNKIIVTIFMVLIIMFQFIGNRYVSANSKQNNDITNLVNIDPISIFIIKGTEKIPVIKDGSYVENLPEIKLGDLLEFKYQFHISEESMKKVSVGDYFNIKLPDSQYIKTVEGTFDIKNSEGEILAKYTIKDGILKVVFTKIASQQVKEDGWIIINGTAVKEGKDISIDADGNTKITIMPGGGSGESGGNDGGKVEIQEEKIKFSKDGKQYVGKNILNWHLNINYDGLRQMMEGKSVDEKKNVILEDTLPTNVSADLSTVYVSTPLFVPTMDNKMSGYAIGYPAIRPEILTPEENESYDDFYERIRLSKRLVMGIYNKNGKNSVLFGFGDLPNNGLKYENILGSESEFHKIIDNRVKNGDITEQQANRMKEVYGSGGTSKGHVLGYDVSFDTNVSGESGEYENKARLHWNTDSNDNAKYSIVFNKTEAGIIGNEHDKIKVKVTKEWENITGKKPTIKLQLLKNGKNEGSLIELTSGTTTYTWTDLESTDIHGNEYIYTVKEVGETGNYIQIENDWYKVTYGGDQESGLTVTNKKISSWTPMTPPTRDIKVTKEWKGILGNSLDAPVDKIKVELYKDGAATGDIKELTKDNDWAVTFEKLKAYESIENPTIHKYTVKEIGEVESAIQFNGKWFGVTYDGTMAEGFTIVNKEKTPWTPMIPPTREIKVTKDWKDVAGNNLEAPVKKIEVELYKDGEATGNKLELTKDNNWTGEFKNLEVAEGLGSTNYYQYTVKEIGETTGSIKLDGKWFKVSYTGTMKDGFKITNKEEKPWTPMEPTKREVKVTKLWKDHSGNTITSPTDKIIVELYKDGNPTGKKLELTKDNNWTGEFKNLEVANGLGSTDYYKYTVKEVGEDGNIVKFDGKQYKVVYGGSMKDGLTITNEKEAPPTPDKPTVPPNTEKPKVPNTNLPKTGDGTNLYLYAWLMFASGSLLVMLGIRKRKYVKQICNRRTFYAKV